MISDTGSSGNIVAYRCRCGIDAATGGAATGGKVGAGATGGGMVGAGGAGGLTDVVGGPAGGGTG